MKKLLLSLYVACAAGTLFGADVLPDERKPVSWASSVGVNGGIPTTGWSVVDITTLGVATGNSAATNQSAINSAVATYNGTDTVLYFPAGLYLVQETTFGFGRNGVALRGAGMFSTTLRGGGGSVVTIGSDPNYSYSDAYAPVGTVLSGFTRGSTTVVVQNSGNGVNFRSGEAVYCRVPSDPTIPTFSHAVTLGGMLDHMNYVVTAVNNGDTTFTLTLQQPVARDYVGTVVMVQAQPGLNMVKRVGVEDLTLDADSVYGRNGIQTFSATNFWIKNVRVINHDNYGVATYGSVTGTVTGSFIMESTGTGSSHAGMAIYSNCNGILLEDNIVVDNYSGILVQTSMNCAVSHNFIFACPVALSPNHSASPHHNIFEGNVVDNSNTDGTHGGSSTTAFVRNWFMCVSDNPMNPTTWNTTTGLPVLASEVYGFSAKRWTVKYSLIQNIFGTPGYTEPASPINLDGQPNLGNGSNDGYGTYGGALSTLTTRGGDDSGTVTAPSGHGITTGAVIDVYWGAIGGDSYAHSYVRHNMTVGTVSGTSIPVSGGFGDVLPASSSAVFVPTENAAVRTYPLDWDATNFRPHRWVATLTTKDIPTSLVFTVKNDESSVATASARVDRMIANDAWNGNVAVFLIGGYQTAQTTAPMSGSTLTFKLQLGAWFDSMVEGNDYYLNPSAAGFQEMDLDVRRTTIARRNRTRAGTLVLDDLQAGESVQPSYIYGSAPPFLNGYAFPVFDTENIGTLSVRRLPAGDRYMTFLDTGSFESGGGGGTAVNAATLNVGRIIRAP